MSPWSAGEAPGMERPGYSFHIVPLPGHLQNDPMDLMSLGPHGWSIKHGTLWFQCRTERQSEFSLKMNPISNGFVSIHLFSQDIWTQKGQVPVWILSRFQ